MVSNPGSTLEKTAGKRKSILVDLSTPKPVQRANYTNKVPKGESIYDRCGNTVQKYLNTHHKKITKDLPSSENKVCKAYYELSSGPKNSVEHMKGYDKSLSSLSNRNVFTGEKKALAKKRDVSQYARAKPKSMSSKNQYAGKDKFIREKSMSYEGVRKRYDKENNNLYKGKKSAA